MWYEILPSFGIIVIAMSLPHYASYVMNKAVNGNGYKRRLLTDVEMKQYLRDWRLTGTPYKVNALNAIPDE